MRFKPGQENVFFKWAPMVIVIVMCLCSCSRVTRHKVLSTIFDGVPSLPPVEEIIAEYQAEHPGQPTQEDAQAAAQSDNGSRHKPFSEKDCEGCHAFGKGTGLKLPREKLCLSCHTDFIRGPFVHGPVAVGDCLACHLPHKSENPALLTLAKDRLCENCHQERRLARRMHNRVSEHGLSCAQCHDPHDGDASYFLK